MSSSRSHGIRHGFAVVSFGVETTPDCLFADVADSTKSVLGITTIGQRSQKEFQSARAVLAEMHNTFACRDGPERGEPEPAGPRDDGKEAGRAHQHACSITLRTSQENQERKQSGFVTGGKDEDL